MDTTDCLNYIIVGPLEDKVTDANVGGRKVFSGDGILSGETGRFNGGAMTKDAYPDTMCKGGEREEVYVSQGGKEMDKRGRKHKVG